MSAFDDLIARLAEKNLSDMEVDKIVNEGIGLIGVLGGSEEFLAQLDSLKKQAEAKKQNKDIKYIDGIDNMKDMNDAINSYNVRNDKGFTNYAAQALLADKLADLSEKADGKEVYKLVNNLMKDDSILENGTKEQKEIFAGSICTAYAFAVDSKEFSPKEALTMLDNVSDLAMHTQVPDAAFANVAVCLDDKEVAERFCAYTEKMLYKMKAQGMVVGADELIDAYAKIVEHHPEMAIKCNTLVEKTANLFESDNSENIGKVVGYLDKVNETEGVCEAAKSAARCREDRYKKRLERAVEQENENDNPGYQYEMNPYSRSHTSGGWGM